MGIGSCKWCGKRIEIKRVGRKREYCNHNCYAHYQYENNFKFYKNAAIRSIKQRCMYASFCNVCVNKQARLFSHDIVHKCKFQKDCKFFKPIYKIKKRERFQK